MKFAVAIALLGSVIGKHHHHHNYNLASLEDPLGNQNESLQAGRKEAADIVAKQEAYELKVTTNNKNDNDSDIAMTEDQKNAVRIERNKQMAGGLAHQQLVYVPEEELYIQFY